MPLLPEDYVFFLRLLQKAFSTSFAETLFAEIKFICRFPSLLQSNFCPLLRKDIFIIFFCPFSVKPLTFPVWSTIPKSVFMQFFFSYGSVLRKLWTAWELPWCYPGNAGKCPELPDTDRKLPENCHGTQREMPENWTKTGWEIPLHKLLQESLGNSRDMFWFWPRTATPLCGNCPRLLEEWPGNILRTAREVPADCT